MKRQYRAGKAYKNVHVTSGFKCHKCEKTLINIRELQQHINNESMRVKYIMGDMSGMHNGEYRYYHELVEKFHNPIRVVAYVLAFVFLALHLLHGFNSAFQSVGANNKYTVSLKKFSKIYAIGIPLGFIFIALFHHFVGH